MCPLHCFELHQACSPDYCKVAKSKLTSVVTVAQSIDSSLESISIVFSTELSPDEGSTNLVVNNIHDIIDNQITFWEETPSQLDQQLLYDIQACARRLVGKAAHLIGK